MRTRYEQMTSKALDGYNNFLGDDTDYRDWFGIVGQSRDSGARERSNFRVALQMLGGESDNVRVERYGHWAVGWIEEVYIRPNTKEYAIACEIETALSDYPVLDESDFSNEEQEEAMETWKHCYNPKERIAYIREHKNQFEFDSFSELMSNVRGDSFNGYASEIVG